MRSGRACSARRPTTCRSSPRCASRASRSAPPAPPAGPTRELCAQRSIFLVERTVEHRQRFHVTDGLLHHQPRLRAVVADRIDRRGFLRLHFEVILGKAEDRHEGRFALGGVGPRLDQPAADQRESELALRRVPQVWAPRSGSPPARRPCPPSRRRERPGPPVPLLQVDATITASSCPSPVKSA